MVHDCCLHCFNQFPVHRHFAFMFSLNAFFSRKTLMLIFKPLPLIWRLPQPNHYEGDGGRGEVRLKSRTPCGHPPTYPPEPYAAYTAQLHNQAANARGQTQRSPGAAAKIALQVAQGCGLHIAPWRQGRRPIAKQTQSNRAAADKTLHTDTRASRLSRNRPGRPARIPNGRDRCQPQQVSVAVAARVAPRGGVLTHGACREFARRRAAREREAVRVCLWEHRRHAC